MAISITTVPAPFRAGFAAIKRLSAEDFESIVAALENAPPTGGLKGLTSSVMQRVPTLKRRDVESVLRPLFSLSILVTDEDTPLSEGLSSLSSAIQATGDPELALSEGERGEFERRMERLLKIRAVKIASKVQRVGAEYPHTFHDAMILTDLRPVFDKPEDRPVGCTISHSLRITYHKDGEHKEFFVMLDADDLQSMKKVLQRAEAKAASLKSVLRVADLPDLT